jgi:hypothetical protein
LALARSGISGRKYLGVKVGLSGIGGARTELCAASRNGPRRRSEAWDDGQQAGGDDAAVQGSIAGERGFSSSRPAPDQADTHPWVVKSGSYESRRDEAPKEMTLGTAELALKKSFTRYEALATATELGMDFESLRYDLEQFRMGMDVELEHGPRSPKTDVSGDDSIITGKIALAHLNEFPDYYTRLAVLEGEAAAHWSTHK